MKERLADVTESSGQTRAQTEEITRRIQGANEQMSALSSAMDDISGNAQQITKIAKAIEDIAFQTNILSLNASVEAARAGAAGKGFAVVANEVKQLAAKSAEAAKSATNMVNNTKAIIQTGVELTADTAGSLRAISDVSDQINTISDQLAAAVQDCNIYYFEEPNTPAFYNNKYVKDNVKMPLAHGERVFGRWEYIRYFLDNSIQVIQPDLGNAGGITETKRICDMAYTFDVGVQVHTCATHLLTPPSVQLEACIPNFVIHEQHMRSLNSANMELTTKIILPEKGYLPVTDDIGLGNEWSEKALASEDQITLN